MKSIEDTDYEDLCNDCQEAVGLVIPQFSAAVVGTDPRPPSCDRCGVTLL